jgi:hypothetical protein
VVQGAGRPEFKPQYRKRERERKMNKMEEQVWFLMCRK